MTDSLHIVKLCVGAEAVDDLIRWQKERYPAGNPVHVTRMWPKREAEILSGGSLYWVFKGLILARQRLLGFEERDHGDGIRRCGFVLERDVVLTHPMPRRPFQGWRYLTPADAPPDLPAGRAAELPLPPKLARELAEMGLL